MFNALSEPLPVPETTVDWVLFIPLILGLWLGLLALVSWLSGYRKFLRVFTRHPRVRGRTYHLVSLWCGIGPLAVLYPLCFKLTVGEDGLYLDPYFFIRPFHRPMRVGWRSVISHQKRLVGHKFGFIELPVALTIIGPAATAAAEQLRQYMKKS